MKKNINKYVILLLLATISIIVAAYTVYNFYKKTERRKAQAAIFTVPFIKAAYERDTKTVSRLIEEGIPVDTRDEEIDKVTALMVAAGEGNKTIVEQLLNAGAQVNIANKFGMTPLMFAVSAGHKTIAEKLIEHGADITAREIDVWNNNKPGRSVLMMAVHAHQPPIVTLLLNKGIPQQDINELYRIGEEYVSPLMYAASNGDVEIVKALLKAEATINMQDNNGNTALMHACKGIVTISHPWGLEYKLVDPTLLKHTVELLLEQGAAPSIANNDGKIALDNLEALLHQIKLSGSAQQIYNQIRKLLKQH